ncbi:IS30 family transposase [Psychromonas arctica]|uniref:IS30 family transposase n=1 Tax=Psychromonas arctica TaxID=168275 RepID=A0ABU9HGH6_9GAMM
MVLQSYKEVVHMIPADNGKEFAYHGVLTEHLKCDVYFGDPYCSWQRGLNENANGLLRQYWSKSTDFKKVSQSSIENVIVELNNRLRKKLNYKTPAKLMVVDMVALAA